MKMASTTPFNSKNGQKIHKIQQILLANICKIDVASRALPLNPPWGYEPTLVRGPFFKLSPKTPKLSRLACA